jgi:D-methionine transport system substrate-binding protein
MKNKVLAGILSVVLGASLLVGCTSKDNTKETTTGSSNETTTESNKTAEKSDNKDSGDKTIVIGATPSPHAEILEVAAKELEKEGYTLQIKEFSDYIQPNLGVDSGDLDANFFQHQPYLDQFNEENGTTLVSVADTHYEPIGIYAGKSSSLDSVPDGAQIAVPNDTTNEARALLLLEKQGLIKIKEGAGLNATKTDIVENPKNIEIIEIDAAQVARSLPDVDFGVVNGNYAIQEGLNVNKDALAYETTDSVAAETYANVIVVNKGNEDDEAIKALVKAVTSDEVKKFIEDKYEGAVVPLF